MGLSRTVEETGDRSNVEILFELWTLSVTRRQAEPEKPILDWTTLPRGPVYLSRKGRGYREGNSNCLQVIVYKGPEMELDDPKPCRESRTWR